MIFGLVFVFCLSMVSAFSFSDIFGKATGKAIGNSDSISEVLDDIVNSVDSFDDVSIVVGDDAYLDIMASHTIERILPVIEEEGEGYFKKSSEVSGYQDKNLILVGGPCANPISEQITDLQGYNCDDWKYQEGESLIKVFDNGNGTAILVAGTSFYDTAKISEMIARYKHSSKLKTFDEVVIGTPLEGLCGNEICEEGETDENCFDDCSDEGSVQLTSGLLVQDFDVYGDYVVFVAPDRTVVKDSETLTDGDIPVSEDRFVYLYNLQTRELKKIGEGNSPRIYGDAIVYNDDSIVVYNLLTNEEKSLGHKSSNFKLDIFGDKIVWVEAGSITQATVEGGKYIPATYLPDKLMIHYIGVGNVGITKKLIDIPIKGVVFGGIYDESLVYQAPKYCEPEYCIEQYFGEVVNDDGTHSYEYEEIEQGDADILMYDLAKNKNIRITSDKNDQKFPSIYRDLIVWTDTRDIGEYGNTIYSYNLTNGEEKILEFSKKIKLGIPGMSTGLVFNSGRYITWTDDRNNNEDVYVFDLENDIEKRITYSFQSQGNAKIFGNKLVWIDHRNGGQDLFMAEL
jgi:beta propeller repeat protein